MIEKALKDKAHEVVLSRVTFEVKTNGDIKIIERIPVVSSIGFDDEEFEDENHVLNIYFTGEKVKLDKKFESGENNVMTQGIAIESVYESKTVKMYKLIRLYSYFTWRDYRLKEYMRLRGMVSDNV